MNLQDLSGLAHQAILTTQPLAKYWVALPVTPASRMGLAWAESGVRRPEVIFAVSAQELTAAGRLSIVMWDVSGGVGSGLL